jgi:hypothetical protein
MPADPPTDAAFLTKLGLRPGEILGLVRAPDAWLTRLRKLAPVSAATNASRAPEAHVILAWLEPSDDLAKVFAALEGKIPSDGAVWAVIPKKSALAKGEQAVEWSVMQAAGLASGRLVDNKELRFDERYYGTRFVVRKDHR